MSAPAPMSLQLASKEAGKFVAMFTSMSRLSEVIDIAVRAEADEKARKARISVLMNEEATLAESVRFFTAKDAEIHAGIARQLADEKAAQAEQLAMTTASAKELVDGCKAECEALKADVANDIKKSKAKADALKLTVTSRLEELAALDDKIAAAREAMRKLLA